MIIASMEALPFELHEHIFTYLLPHQDHKQHVFLPDSQTEGKTDVTTFG
jgi:hypothetical protein